MKIKIKTESEQCFMLNANGSMLTTHVSIITVSMFGMFYNIVDGLACLHLQEMQLRFVIFANK